MVNAKELHKKLKIQLGSESEAAELLCHFAGLSRAALLRGDGVPAESAQRVLDAAKRRENGEPLQYILGEWEFDGQKIVCKPGVLIPREDTLCLVERAEEKIREAFAAGEKLRILDIGCGSGCVGLSLVRRLRKDYSVTLLSVDIKEECLTLTEENAALWGITELVSAKRCDILSEEPEGVFQVLVSNPPYIKSKDIRVLDTEVKDFEPHVALDGGVDGLLFYRRIADIARELVPGGVVAVETGYDTGEAVKALFEESGYSAAQLYRDSSGQPRVVCVKQ